MSSRSDGWRTRAQTAVAAFETVDNGTEGAFAYAFMAQAIARLYGWDDPRVQPYLDRVYALRNPDGGWGLNYAYDALGNGTVNPPDTTYTVTLAGHVGPVLLDGYRAGVIPREDVKTIVDLLMSTPRISYNTQFGTCLAYSRNSNDTVTYGCVHNVNAGAGAFLLSADAANVGATGLQRLVVDITRRETYAYLPTVTVNGVTRTAWWRYMDTTSLNDTDHNSYQAESMYVLAYPVGREAAYNHMTNTLADNSASPIAHMRLTGLPGGPASMSGETTLWCELGDQWLAEYDAFVASELPHQRYAQAAYYASANALAC